MIIDQFRSIRSLLGAPLPSGYNPSDLGQLLPVQERRVPAPLPVEVPPAWTMQASIEINAHSAYLRRQALWEKLLTAVDLDDSD